MKISIIIPALNEEYNLSTLLPWLQKHGAGIVKEIIVVDGGSNDKTVKIATDHGAVALYSPKKGRATQMNFGAKYASSEILYFLHADTFPPENFTDLITASIKKNSIAGSFRLDFDDDHPLLKLYASFTSMRSILVRFGDQSLFVRRNIFEQSAGFNENLFVMEDQEIFRRLKKYGRLTIIKTPVVTSAQKYRENGVIRLQFIFTVIFLLYYAGTSQKTLVHIYKNLIRTN
ncbi:MAG: glycosyltransferase [Balneolaceae bacterium]|nr:MAG: glycosyltransferase [Balneolaceae bacterium]